MYCFLNTFLKQILFSKKTKQNNNNNKNFSAGQRALTESVLQILLWGVEGIWSGLSLQKLGDQLLEGQAYDRHSALDEKQIQRKRVPSGVYMPMYYIVSADHFNGVLGQARNA